LGNENYENFWKRSILAASISRLLGKRLHVAHLEDLFLASLLQDIGILVIHCIDDSPYDNDQNLKHSDRIQIEMDKLEIDHSVIGAWLLKSWNLPESLVNSVMYSHSLNIPESAKGKADSYFHYCLNLSGSLADIWLDDNSDELLQSILDVAKGVLGVDNTEFNQIIVDIDNFLPEISHMFELSLVEDYDREQVLFHARELLLNRSINAIKQSEDDHRYIESITDRVEKIEKASQIDHLTKVYNRQYIDQLLKTEYEEANINRWPLYLAFIDIDDFKPINDTFGHLVGDEILKLIADFFTVNIREADVLARYGGDEFLLMLPGATSDIAHTALQRLLALFKDKVSLDVKDITISTSVSIGLATHMGKHDFNSLKDFIAAADEALYKAKADGKNRLAIY